MTPAQALEVVLRDLDYLRTIRADSEENEASTQAYALLQSLVEGVGEAVAIVRVSRPFRSTIWEETPLPPSGRYGLYALPPTAQGDEK